MQKFKRFMAVALAATMVVGSSVTAFAADNEGGTTGSGAVSNLPIASTTTAPTVSVTWSYAKAASDATAATDVVDYRTVPESAAPSITTTEGTYKQGCNSWLWNIWRISCSATKNDRFTYCWCSR